MLEDGVDGSEVLGNGNEVFGDGHLDTLQVGVGEKARPFGLGCFRALTCLKTNDDTTGEDELGVDKSTLGGVYVGIANVGKDRAADGYAGNMGT